MWVAPFAIKIFNKNIGELATSIIFSPPSPWKTSHLSLFHAADDFKPASVDVHKEATLETGSNNTITVTLPHLGEYKFCQFLPYGFVINLSFFLFFFPLHRQPIHFLLSNHNRISDGSGVPNTVFKGNHREYSKKECILIINRETNEITLERLSSNVQVKKTRADSQSNKSQQQQQMQSGVAQQSTSSSSMNSAGGGGGSGGGSGSSAGMGKNDGNVTVRHCSKTRVSTGARKSNNILNFVPKNSPNTLQGSPSYSHSHRSPQQAPLWVFRIVFSDISFVHDTFHNFIRSFLLFFLFCFCFRGRNRWNANNTQQTLPSIPSLLDDNNFTSNQAPSSVPTISSSSVYSKSSNVSNNSMAAVSMPKASSVSLMAQQQQQQQSQSVMDDVSRV